MCLTETIGPNRNIKIPEYLDTANTNFKLWFVRIYYQNGWPAVICAILAALDGSKSVWSGIAKHASNKLSVTMQNLECRNLTLLVVACCGLAPVLLTSPEFILNRVGALKVLHFTPCLYFHVSKSGSVTLPAFAMLKLLLFFIAEDIMALAAGKSNNGRKSRKWEESIVKFRDVRRVRCRF